MRIFAFHLLNDFSGSPKVLMQLARGWSREGLEVTLVTSKGRNGFLSGLEGVSYRYFPYQWKANPLLRFLMLFYSQAALFFKMLTVVKRGDIVYINTVLPFGAAFLGKVKGCRVVYHIHETTMKPAALKRFLFGVARLAADDVIYVSAYLASQESFRGKQTHILYNALEEPFLNKALEERQVIERPRNVLMVCSLKDYKGVREFVSLAVDNPGYHFRLVMNASQPEIDAYFSGSPLPANLEMYPTQTDLHPFYRWAHLVVNLSRPDGWVETFGLTIIEGMAYGLPALVPPVGGITELVEEGVNGFRVDSRNREELNACLKRLLEDPRLYESMHKNAGKRASGFREEEFIRNSMTCLGIA